jgi:hypothetical protein
MNTPISAGTVHELPADLKKALTPLARNEWICWNTFVKQAGTREHHIKRTITELQEGKRRPCCWLGCPHRTDKELSPSVKWVLSKKSK